jgi:hypothetical protein
MKKTALKSSFHLHGMIKGIAKATILFIAISCILISCEKKEVAYYHFRDSDWDKLLDHYIKGKSLVFKNAEGEERVFDVYFETFSQKEQYAVGMGFFSESAGDYFYYDTKRIGFVTRDANKKLFFIHALRFPENTEIAKSDIYTEFPSRFHVTIEFFPYWNNPAQSYLTIVADTLKTEMTINGSIYKNVVTFHSERSEAYQAEDGYVKDVNILYYDEIQGIIGFDALNGQQWKLVNDQ